MARKSPAKSLTQTIIIWIRKNKARFKFCLFFVVYVGIFFGLYILGTIFTEGAINSLNVFTARSIHFAAKLLGIESFVASSYLTVKGFSIKIIIECTGLFAVFVFLACVLAYPTDFKKKLVGISAGFLVIYFLNIIRMLCLIFIGIWAPKYFDFVHVYLWEGVFIIVAIILWMIWLDKVVKSVR